MSEQTTTGTTGLPAPAPAGTAVPPLEVVVVTYRSRDLVDGCLGSALAHTPPGTRVHVVDNGSTDGTVEHVRARYPDVAVTVRPDNPGFAVANNLVLRSVRAPVVLLLNPDCELHAGTVDHLLARLAAEPNVGVLGCRLLTADGTLDHAAKRMIPSPLEAARYFAARVVGRRGGRYTAPDLDEHASGDVDAVNGAFMLVRTSALAEVGLLDEAYWMYGEDLDWCTRFRRAGWRVVYDGTVSSTHLKGGSAGVRSVRLNYHFHRSMARYYRTHGGAPVPVRAAVTGAVWARFAAVATVDTARRALAAAPGGRRTA